MQKDLLLEENVVVNAIRSNTPAPNVSKHHLTRTATHNPVHQRC